MTKWIGNDNQPPRAQSHRSALTLLEMMVAVTLLALIMVGLLAMFQQTQRALHVAHAQTDVFENARGAVELIARDLSEMTTYDDTNIPNFNLTWIPNSISTVALPSTGNQRLDLDEAFWLTRVNDDWQGIGYYVTDDSTGRGNFGVGTLYRFDRTTNHAAVPFLQNYFADVTVTNHRVSDGIVHFSMETAYVDHTNQFGVPFYGRASNITFFSSASFAPLPAFIDVELGVLEPETLKQFHSLTDNAVAAQTFLQNHVGRIHFFRERVPIRNFINPYRSNEVP